MSAPSQALGFTRIPQKVTDALQQGDINPTQFIILVLLHLWANHRTGRVDSFCAERVCRALHIDTTRRANVVAMRRQIAGLRAMGWFRWDYAKGSKRPYHIWIHNFVIYLGSDAVPDDVLGTVPEELAAGTILYPCEIRSYQNVIDGEQNVDVPDDVPENAMSLCPTNQERLNTSFTMKDNPAEKDNLSDPAVVDAEELLSFIYELTGFTRPRKWALRLVERYPVLELMYALVEWMYGERHDGDPSTKALGFFFKEGEGYETVIRARRKRNGAFTNRPNLTPPPEWQKALDRIKERQPVPENDMLEKSTLGTEQNNAGASSN